MRKIIAATALLMAFSVPAFAGWIDQTGATCDPSARAECIYVEDLSAAPSDDSGVFSLIVDGLSALLS